jgi:hypothetical protein
MNKLNKELLEKEFDFFLKRNNLIVAVDNKSFHRSIGIRKRKAMDTDRNEAYYKNDFLYVEKPKNVFGNNFNDDFIRYLLSKKESQDIAVEFMVSKEIGVTHYNYDSFISGNLDILKDYKESFFKYIYRAKFLETNLKKLDNLFNIVQEQSKRELLVEKCLVLKTFKSLESKTYVYNLIQKTIIDKKKYNEFFSDIIPLDKSDILFKSIMENVIHFSFTVAQLNMIDLDKNYSANKILIKVKYLAEQLNIRDLSSMGIRMVTMTQSNQDIRLDLCGNNLKQDVIELFINTLLITYFKLDDNNRNNIENVINEVLVTTNMKMLDKNLITKDMKLKIHKI